MYITPEYIYLRRYLYIFIYIHIFSGVYPLCVRACVRARACVCRYIKYTYAPDVCQHVAIQMGCGLAAHV